MEAVDVGVPERSEPISPHFTGVELDGVPRLLEASYNLRYQVYCHEREFLPADKYPDQLEVDAFDRYSVHLGVVNLRGDLVATARLVQPSAEGLPVFSHCTLFPGALPMHDPTFRVAEISRLSVSRTYNRRAGDGFFSLQGPTPLRKQAERRGGGEIVMTMYKAVYHASKRRGHTHWIAATEKSLQRLFSRYRFPFRPIGPETDYYGIVAPYLMDLRDFDRLILSGEVPPLAEFLHGLEPQFRPTGDPRRDEAHAAHAASRSAH
jgi:N-acyl amino acid synthase of PEP-CTERM/exosortase system